MDTYNKNDKMWAFMLYLGTNKDGKPNEYLNFQWEEEVVYHDTLYSDRETWNQITEFMPTCGINTILIDMGEGVKLDSHPEIAVPGSWEKEDFIQELDRLRSLGLTPLPKFKFSCMHNAWMQDYGNMVGTKACDQFCADIIRETIEMFGKPEYFHLGMEEEVIKNQGHYKVMVERSWTKKTEDLLFLCNVCMEQGVRPWIWVDAQSIEGLGGAENFCKNVPKDVLISNWWYDDIYYDGENEKPRTKLYRDIAEWGYEQIPTCSGWSNPYNARQTLRYCKEYVKEESIKGFMTAPWMHVMPTKINGLRSEAYVFGQAKKKIYPEDCD